MIPLEESLVLRPWQRVQEVAQSFLRESTLPVFSEKGECVGILVAENCNEVKNWGILALELGGNSIRFSLLFSSLNFHFFLVVRVFFLVFFPFFLRFFSHFFLVAFD